MGPVKLWYFFLDSFINKIKNHIRISHSLIARIPFLYFSFGLINYKNKASSIFATTTTKSATAEPLKDYSKLFDGASVSLTPD